MRSLDIVNMNALHRCKTLYFRNNSLIGIHKRSNCSNSRYYSCAFGPNIVTGQRFGLLKCNFCETLHTLLCYKKKTLHLYV